jgi:hypothetical protein
LYAVIRLAPASAQTPNESSSVDGDVIISLAISVFEVPSAISPMPVPFLVAACLRADMSAFRPSTLKYMLRLPKLCESSRPPHAAP